MTKIGVVGLGLIGGSVFKDLARLGYDVIGISQSQSGENIFNDYTLLKDCEIVFVCCEMNKILEILDKLETILPKSTIVTDVCSIKGFVCKKDRPYNFIPSHPMAGTEKKGFENSYCGLFEKAKWVITPYKNTPIPQILTTIIKQLGAIPIITTYSQHDKAVALISHMPMLISQAIFKTAESNDLALKIASSGFRDMTRLAMTNIELANDMITINSENIEKSLLKLYASIGELIKGDYKKEIKDICEKRANMFNNKISE